MTDKDIPIPGLPSPAARFHMRRMAQTNSHVSNVSVSNPDNSKSSAQVATSVEQKIVQHQSGGLKPNKSKHSRFGIRLSENEREIVVQQAAKSCLTISEYVRASVLGAGYISLIDPVKRDLLQKISRELNRQGTNVNDHRLKPVASSYG